MENTIIVKEDGRAINSDEHFDYAIVITDFSRMEEVVTPDGDVVEELERPITIELRATAKPDGGDGEAGKTVLISTFYDFQEASDALQELVSTIEGKYLASEIEMFDVRKYNSNV